MKPVFSQLGGSLAAVLAIGLVMACDSVGSSPTRTLQAFLTDIHNQNFTGAVGYLPSKDRAQGGGDEAKAYLALASDGGSGLHFVITGERVRGDSAWVYFHEDGKTRPDTIAMMKEPSGWKILLSYE